MEEDDIPDDFLVDEIEEVTGAKDLYFKVYVKNANSLPKNLCLNPYVTYQMQHEKEKTVYEVPKIMG